MSLRLVPLLPLLALVAACRTPEAARPPLSTEVFADVTAPEGAVYRYWENESFSYQSESFRVGRFVYDYKGTHRDVVEFYKDVLTRTPYNWELVEERSVGEGSTRLVFNKNGDDAWVDIDYTPLRSEDRDDIVIVVRVNHQG